MRRIKTFLLKLLGKRKPNVSYLDVLKSRGLKVGDDFFMAPGCVLDPAHCFHISIGNNVALGPEVYILAHDSIMHRFIGYGNVANVKIGDDVTISTRAVILPGVTIGNRVMIGAGAVVTKDIPENSIAVGNPAKVIGTFDAYIEKHIKALATKPKFDESYLIENNLSIIQKQEMIKACDEIGSIYLK
jgi:maltose O-acetyltransferase